ncbi:MAG TPA: hypothetical protein VGC08_12045 [Pedobacter sp.]
MEGQEEKDQKKTERTANDPFQPKGPRDGYDNTGTQGYDSLKDDGYTGSSPKDVNSGHEDGTGSSSKDFPDSHIAED